MTEMQHSQSHNVNRLMLG